MHVIVDYIQFAIYAIPGFVILPPKHFIIIIILYLLCTLVLNSRIIQIAICSCIMYSI